MCGICGIVNFDKRVISDARIVHSMTNTLKHRGPDNEGYFIRNPIGLGHRRLSIIDLATGNQPLFNEDASCSIILNGEVYNFQELQNELRRKNHIFKTRSDTEVVIHAYEEYGFECVKYLRGMFAFAIWDDKKEILFLVRDRLGKKPLYYYYDSQKFIFASEIKALLKTGFVKAEVNKEAIDEFLSLGYVIAPNTLFRNIKKVLPGDMVIVKDGKITQQEYWNLEAIHQENRSLNEFQNELRDILDESVKLRMISDVPLGAFLSGGIDSSIIVGIMSKFSNQPVKTFSVGYKNQRKFSELGYAQIVANYFKTEHHEIILEPVDFYGAIPQMVWHLDEPIADQACIPLWLMSKEAKKFVTVLLSGEGSDELFAGYPIYSLMQGFEKYQKIPLWLRSYLVDPLITRILGERRGQKYVEWSRLPLEERFLGDMADFSTNLRKQLYSPEFLGFSSQNDFRARIRNFYNKVQGRDSLDKMQYLDMKTWLVDDLLLKADKMTMAASVELRCPFLDHKLVEFSRKLPSKLKLNRVTTKYILKETYEKFLPKEIAYRKKKGFPVPLTSWFQGDLNKQIEEILLNKRTLQRNYFNRGFIKEIIEKQSQKKEDYSKLLWSLLVLEFWHRVFIDGDTVG